MTPSITALIDARAVEALAGIAQAFRELRLRYRVPPFALMAGRQLLLPASYACPECGSRLGVEVHEWETGSGRVTPGGYSVYCPAEEAAMHEIWSRDGSFEEEREVMHRYWQGDWMPLQDRAGRWLRRNVRVYE